MRKIIYKFLGILAIASVGFQYGCEDGDQTVDQALNDVTRGAILRTIDQSSAILFDVATSDLDDNGIFTVTVEEQDQEGGALLASLDVFLGFNDETEGGTDNSRDEVLFDNIPASAFSPGPFGLPRTTYSVTTPDFLSTLAITDAETFGGDQFTVRFELVLTDGRRFSNDDNSGTLTGSFFRSPFLYFVDVVCAPSMPTAGTWMVSTTDTFGDGWNGGALNITLDGGTPFTIENIDDGTRPFAESVQDLTFEVPDGTQTISITYSGGSFDEEVAFSVVSANGTMVIEVEQADAGPPTGVELLDFCPDNL